MTWPGWRDWLFSGKNFLAACLALYVAFALDLPRPYWAMVTVYALAQPFSGTVRAKALYRIAGTIVGAAAAVFLVTSLSTAPELLSLATFSWIGSCVYLSVLRRTGDSYAFLLASLTTSVIVFTDVNAPGGVFDTALARVEEITLGILCATLVSDLVLPQHIGDVFARRLDSWTAEARQLAVEVLGGGGARPLDPARLRRLISEMSALYVMRDQAVRDTGRLRGARSSLLQLQRRMQMFFALIDAIQDRMAALRGDAPELLRPIEPLLARAATRLAGGLTSGSADELLAAIDAAKPADAALRERQGQLLLRSLLDRLGDLVATAGAAGDLRRLVAQGRPVRGETPALPIYSDNALALLSGAAVGLIGLLSSAYWIASASPNGGSAVINGAVVASFTAGADRPVPGAAKFGLGLAVACVVMGVWNYSVFQLIDGWPLLFASLAPLLLLGGVLSAQPGLAPVAGPAMLLLGSQSGLTNQMSYDFAGYVNGVLGSLAGIAVAIAVLKVVRSFGTEAVARRLVASIFRDLARIARGERASRAAFESLALDRLDGLAARLTGPAAADADRVVRMLAAVRAGHNLFVLRELEPVLAPGLRTRLAALRQGLARHFRACERDPGRPADALRPLLRNAFRRVAAAPVSGATTDALLVLGGLSRALFPNDPGRLPDAPLAARELAA